MTMTRHKSMTVCLLASKMNVTFRQAREVIDIVDAMGNDTLTGDIALCRRLAEVALDHIPYLPPEEGAELPRQQDVPRPNRDGPRDRRSYAD
jgi:hypothetical protein